MVASGTGAPALSLPGGYGNITLDGGDPAAPITEDFTISDASKISILASPGDKTRLSLQITPATGVFTGSFYEGDSNLLLKRTFGGVLLQDQSVAAGVFLGPDQTGSIELEAAP